MRAFLYFLPFIVVGCSSSDNTIYSVSQRQILKQSQVEIDRRESWAPNAAIFVTNPSEISRHTWKVRAGAFDYSDSPHYRGIHFVSGTERELRFTADGCLTRYADRGNHCLTADSTESSAMPMYQGK